MESAIFLPSANQLGNFNVKSDTFSKTFPPTNQLGQIFEKSQKFFNPLTNQLGIFQSNLVEIFKTKQKKSPNNI